MNLLGFRKCNCQTIFPNKDGFLIWGLDLDGAVYSYQKADSILEASKNPLVNLCLNSTSWMMGMSPSSTEYITETDLREVPEAPRNEESLQVLHAAEE